MALCVLCLHQTSSVSENNRTFRLLLRASTDFHSQMIVLLLLLFYCYHQNSFWSFSQCSHLLLSTVRQMFSFFLNSIISVYCLLPAAPCNDNTFFCHSNMCINNSLVCNGVQNCVYPWDENHCKGDYLLSSSQLIKIYMACLQSLDLLLNFPVFIAVVPLVNLFATEKRSKGLFHQITKTHGTVIGVSSGIVLVLLIISILVQMKQPRKKVIQSLFCHWLWLDFHDFHSTKRCWSLKR